MKRSFALMLLVVLFGAAQGQADKQRHANVIPYDEEAGIKKLAYRDSPYYLELKGTWKQRSTDSSIIYSRQVEAEKTWKDYLVYLNVRCGRACRVSLNGKEVGYGDDSRSMNEFLLTGHLKYGKPNQLTIETLRSPRSGMLEDTSIAVGLNGEPYIVFKSDPGVADIGVSTDYDAAIGEASLTVDARIFNSRKKGRYYLEAELWDPKGRQFDRMGRWVVFDKRDEEEVELTRTWTGVEAWTAETPTLYSLVVRLRDEKMQEEEVVGARIGFRRVEIQEGQLRVNGKGITLKGVLYGIEHTEGYASREQMRRDVEAMKRSNVNAVRTARFSPMDEYFYELCDRYGLYVFCDANLMPRSTQQEVVATDAEYVPLFERRVENMYYALRNHPSIICWTLGNSADNGLCMGAAYRRLKAIEKSRPVVYAGAGFSENTDIVAFLSPGTKELRQAVEKGGERPYVILHAVGDENFGNLEEIWNIVKNGRQLQGGFAKEWPMGSLQLAELKQMYSPFEIMMEKILRDEGEFRVYNTNDFGSFSSYALEYTIYTNLRSNIIAGDLPVAMKGGESDKVSMRIPDLELQAGEEQFIRFDVNRRKNSKIEWIGNGKGDLYVGSKVFAIEQEEVKRKPIEMEGKRLHVEQADSVNVRLRGEGFEVWLGRDEAAVCLRDEQGRERALPVLTFAGHADWQKRVLAAVCREVDSTRVCMDVMLQYRDRAGLPMCDVRMGCMVMASGDVVCEYTIVPTERTKGELEGCIEILKSTAEEEEVCWFGYERELLFPKGETMTGLYRLPFGRLTGTRGGVRWCSVGKEEGVFFRLIDEWGTIGKRGEKMCISPKKGTLNFRLHLCLYNEARGAEECYAAECPKVETGIPEPPSIKASEVRFSQPMKVSMSSEEKGIIRYTLDGTEPNESSPIYSKPFVLEETAVVKARVFSEGKPPSFTTTRRFNYDYIVRTTFSRKPSTPYNLGADTILFDGEKGTVSDMTHGWLGFSGAAVQTRVELAKSLDVDEVMVRYAHSPAVWAFAPKSVCLRFSSDGQTWTDSVVYELPFDPEDAAQEEAKVVELHIPVGKEEVGYISIEPRTVETIPAWHRAKGLKPWMMMDEVEVTEKIKKQEVEKK